MTATSLDTDLLPLPELSFNHISALDALTAEQSALLKASSHPFLNFDFLSALEEHKLVCEQTGWQVCHLLVSSKRQPDTLLLFMPLYIKSHSYGEFVFDHSWANAYYQHGLEYYPKLVACIPFTPVVEQKYLFAESLALKQQQALIAQIKPHLSQFCQQNKLSSFHLLFQQDVKDWQDTQFMLRTNVHFYWENQQYSDFADFLASLKSRKRKNLKKERAAVVQQGIKFEHLSAQAIESWHIKEFYQLYLRQQHKYGKQAGYLNLDFFLQLQQSQPQSIVLIRAFKKQAQKSLSVAYALCFKDQQHLYGRYWGSSDEFQFLHFETCYYQGIEYCIQHQLQYFDPGVQGEHKLARGFLPRYTQSIHYLKHAEFSHAIAEFLQQECAQYVDYHADCQAQSIFRNEI